MNSRATPFGPYAPRRRTAPGGDPDSVDLRALLRALWRRKWIVAGAAVIGAFLALAAVSRVEPVYTAVSKVMLDARKATVVPGAEVIGDLDLRGEVVLGEISVLRSNVLMERVVSEVGIDRLGAVLDPEGALVIPEGPFASMTPEEVRIERLVWALRRSVTIWREGESFVIGITVETSDPVLSAEIANAIAAAYIDGQLAARRSFATGATRWIEERAEDLRLQVETAEAAVEEYRAGTVLSGGDSQTSASGQLAELNEQLAIARADRVSAEARLARMTEVLEREGPTGMTGLVSSPLIDTLGAERIALTRRDAEWAERYGSDHPERVRIATELERVDADLRAEIEARVEAVRSDVEIAVLREASLAEGIDETEARLIDLSRGAIGLRQLEREANAARSAYEALLSRLSETRTQEQLQQPDAVVIERATIPGAPSAPRPKLMIAVGAVVGTLAGLAWVLFGTLTALGYSSLTRLEAETGLPALSVIPQARLRNPRAAVEALRKEPHGAYAERVRALRTALLVQDGKDEPRSVMLMSSLPDEGKTTTLLSLAALSAAAGRSVIVVDCDLRRASIGQVFGGKEGGDFAGFIREDCDLSEAIHHDEGLGADVLAPRKPAPDLSDQLSPHWLGPLFDELKKIYDVVLVDAPAVLSVSDALVVAPGVDSRVYLVRAVKTPRGAVAKGLGLLDEAGITLTGTAMTMADPRDVADSYHEAYAAYA